MGKERFDEMMARMENPKPGGLAFARRRPAGLRRRVLAIQARFSSFSAGCFRRRAPSFPFSPFFSTPLIDGASRQSCPSRPDPHPEIGDSTSTSLAFPAPGAEITSLTYLLLGQVDFFQPWMFGVLGFGLAAAFKIPLKKGMILSYALWAAKVR